MAESMIERVARALAVNHYGDADRAIYAKRDGKDWSGPAWQVFVADARSALTAMHEPTQEMNAAGDAAEYDHPDYTPEASDELRLARWQAMIDAALT